MRGADRTQPAPSVTAEQARVLLPILEARRAQVDEQLWTGPSLLIAAQAFLYAAAFATHGATRVIVLAVGLAPLFAAWQAMAKKRYLETLHSEAVARCLEALGQPEVRRGNPNTFLYDARSRGAVYERVVITPKNHYVWLWVFAIFIAADVALLVISLA